MPLLQDLIHKLEVGAGARYARILLAVLTVLLLFVGYNWRAYRNFTTQEAMDSAQLARNLAEGRGYTTKFIRPFSMFLLKRSSQDRLDSLTPEQRTDLCQVKGLHPDLANPPMYPVVLAGLMKVLPFQHDLSQKRPFWWIGESFVRFQPDFVIAIFNQMLLFVLVLMTFLLARRLFDAPVAWLSAILVFGTELLWRFSVSGLSTLLLLVIFMGLAWLIVSFEAAVRDPKATNQRVLAWAAGLGLLLGVGMLTRYSFGFVLLPVLGFVLAIAGRWRVQAALVIVGVGVAVVTPWLVRNVSLCGAPFGTASYALLENSFFFPQHRLERSLTPDFSQIWLAPLWWKFFINLRKIVATELLQFGGIWVVAFFFVGLMVTFRNQAIARVRHFVLATLVTLIVAQALGRTALTEDSPEINSENLLVLLLPLVMIYGVAFFFAMLEQMPLPFALARYLIIGAFVSLAVLPLVFTFLPPRPSPSAFPPYHPPTIQTIAGWIHEDELVMSDIPWAVAWYGNRQSVLQTLEVLEPESDYYTLNDYVKPVKALYLTPVSLDAKFLTQWARGGSERSWGVLIMAALNNEVLPPRFPLRKSVRLSEQLFLSDWERWAKPDTDAAKP